LSGQSSSVLADAGACDSKGRGKRCGFFFWEESRAMQQKHIAKR
jgi:hypothetical protein